MHFILKLFKSGIPKGLEFLADDLRIRLQEQMREIKTALADLSFSHAV
jgi:hypothetical protein